MTPKFITVKEMATRIHSTEKFVRQRIVGDNKVDYLRKGRTYLIVESSADEWVRVNVHRARRVR